MEVDLPILLLNSSRLFVSALVKLTILGQKTPKCIPNSSLLNPLSDYFSHEELQDVESP